MNLDVLCGPRRQGDASDCRTCGRDTCTGCNVAESLPDLLARVDSIAERPDRVGELIPDEGIVGWGGRPRAMKSLSAEDVLLSLVLGEPYALGNPRFKIPEPGAVLWLSGEDSERTIGTRARLLLAGRDKPALERLVNFRVKVARGLNLEVRESQDAVVRMINETAPTMTRPLEVLLIDPTRSFTPGFDGGPKDGHPGRQGLERIRRETGIKVIVLLAHETKPGRLDKGDTRPHAERFSGGIIFSISDCPVSFGRQDDRTTLATPSMYKLSADPQPFRIRFESETPSGQPFRSFIRAVAQDVNASDAAAEVDLKILSFVEGHPNSSTQEVIDGSGVKAETVPARLHALKDRGTLVLVTGEAAKALGRRSTAKLWRVAK